jgi:hypothetical protein
LERKAGDRAASKGGPGGVRVSDWPLIRLLRQFGEGFSPRSWRHAASEEIEADLRRVDRIAKVALESEIDPERTKALPSRRQPLLLQQAAIRRLANRVCGLLSVVTVIAAPFLSVGWLHTSPVNADFFFRYLLVVLLGLDLTRFRGHCSPWGEEGVHDAKDPTAVSS